MKRCSLLFNHERTANSYHNETAYTTVRMAKFFKNLIRTSNNKDAKQLGLSYIVVKWPSHFGNTSVYYKTKLTLSL